MPMPPERYTDAPPLADALAHTLAQASAAAGDAPPISTAIADAVRALAGATAAGHSCLPLTATAAPLDLLRASALVRGADTVLPLGRAAPLVIDAAGRLYFARHFGREQRLAMRLLALPPHPLDAAASGRVRAALDARFGDAPEQASQKQAVALALENGLTVIAGGPGTGKTTTVVEILGLLLATAPSARIALAAPTGKAAARLLDAVSRGGTRLPAAQQAFLPSRAYTLTACSVSPPASP